MTFFKPIFWDKKQISIFSILLFPIALLVRFVVFLKPIFVKTHKCNFPTICVGNIYIGGTGKTPLCIEIFLILKSLNMNPVFIRKEYDSQKDEVALQKKVGPVCQNKKRILAIKDSIKNGFNIGVLDDGFQDFSVNKTLSIICFSEKQWIGNGLSIPAGPLRENLSALKRADCVVINGKKNTEIENKILSKNKKLKIFYTRYKAQNAQEFKNKKVLAFAGIGNPNNFFDFLKYNKIKLIEEIKFPDHYNYSESEIEKLINRTKKNDAILLTTEKDYFRISEKYKKDINYLKLELDIENRNELVHEIKKII